MADRTIIEAQKKQLELLEIENAKLLQELDLARQIEANLREQNGTLRQLISELMSATNQS